MTLLRGSRLGSRLAVRGGHAHGHGYVHPTPPRYQNGFLFNEKVQSLHCVTHYYS